MRNRIIKVAVVQAEVGDNVEAGPTREAVDRVLSFLIEHLR